jgi:tetratricopeptide (TPR) repeat protein
VATDFGKVEVWNLDTGEKSTVVTDADFWPNVLCWNPDGTELAISTNHDDDEKVSAAVTIYDVGLAQERLNLLHGPGFHITTISWSADGKYLLTGVGTTDDPADAIVRQWDTGTGQMVKSFPGMGAAWSPDGKRFAIIRVYAVDIHDAGSGTRLLRCPHPGLAHHEMCWSPDGKYLAVPFGPSVDIWDTGTGRSAKALPGHIDSWVVAWSPDGKRLAAGSISGTLRLWDVSSGSLALVLRAHEQPLAGLAWSADGLRIASAGEDGTIRIWDATRGALRDHDPTLLPMIDGRIAAGPNDMDAIRTRAVIRARNEDWAGAAADFDQLNQLRGERTSSYFTTGWWSVPSLPADVPDPFFPAKSDGPRPRLPVRPGWYSHADDPNGFIPLPAHPPALITRVYAAAEGDVVVKSSPLLLKLRFNGERQQAATRVHLLALRKGWNTLVLELENREEVFAITNKPNAGLFVSISDSAVEIVAALWAEGQHERAVAVAEKALRETPRDVAALRLSFRAYDQYLEKLESDREAPAEAVSRVRGRMFEILESMAVHLDALLKRKPDDPELTSTIGDLYCVMDWERAIRAYSSLINEQTSDAELFAKRAEAYERAGHREKSNADWARAVELNPKDTKLRQRRLAMLEASEQWAEIAAGYSQQLDALPQGWRRNEPRSQLLANLIRRRDPLFAALRNLRSDDSLLDVALGRDCVTRSAWSQAASVYPQDIDKVLDPEGWYECAAALLLAGKPDEYRALLKRMLERSEKADDPFMAYAVARAASIAPQKVIPWPEVVRRAELAANQPNAEPSYSHVAGLAQFRAGEYDKALTWLQQSAAAKGNPELNQIASCLVYVARGEFDKARDCLEPPRRWLATKEDEQHKGSDSEVLCGRSVLRGYLVQPPDWLELHLLVIEAEALIPAKP